VAIPVICLEPFLYDEMAMTGSNPTDQGFAPAQTQIGIVAPGHALAAGLTGTVTVLSQAHSIGFGGPSPVAMRVATVVGQPGQFAAFAYTAGAMMVGRTAPARRVGWFALHTAFASLNGEGVRMFDAAIDWAMGGS
jgi:hypothetical protein